ncbi:Uncharacterised protein [Mycobacteroides abscessus subsp. abscessus]|nr:Uncharacterised protein [Mycobacteroides abscessus subsp. abscessus]
MLTGVFALLAVAVTAVGGFAARGRAPSPAL